MLNLPLTFFRRGARKRRITALVAGLLGFWWIFAVVLSTIPRRPVWADSAVSPDQRADAVKQTFKFAWDGYYKHAFPHDELYPMWNTYGNSRNGWGATAVESLGTAIIMDIPEIVDQILDFIPKIDFHKTDSEVNLFETTIRYIGGMLSAYDLLKGPMHHLAQKREAVESLLTQSLELANILKFAFKTPSGVPWKLLRIDEQANAGSEINTAASFGTLDLEWTRLSDLTGQPEYAMLVDKAMQPLLNPQPSWSEAYPGITGTWVNVRTGQFTDDRGSWGAGGDSFYEYLIKMFAYDHSRFRVHKDRWIMAADSVIKYLADGPQDPKLSFISMISGKKIHHESSHLECFAGGNFILAGKILNDTRYLDFGLKLTESCHEMYTRTATGLAPERIRWPTASMTPAQWKEYEQLGYAITDSSYQLRPETMESYYYAYRATGDRKYQEWAWDAFVAIVTYTKTRNGFAPISNVNSVSGGLKQTRQESFFFSETLKYAYLIFADEAEYQFNYKGHNEWIFNTEGHPLKIGGTPI